MSKLCDRSPCNSLLEALGSFIFGSSTQEGFFMIVAVGNKAKEININYCPFCGTRLEEVPSVLVNRFMKRKKN